MKPSVQSLRMIGLWSVGTSTREVCPAEGRDELSECFRGLGGIFSIFCGTRNLDSDIRHVRKEYLMFGISFPRAIIIALVPLSILVIRRYPPGKIYQHIQGGPMASTLKTLIVPPKGKHTATVIFMHVCHYRRASTRFFSDTSILTGTWRHWLWLEASSRSARARPEFPAH